MDDAATRARDLRSHYERHAALTFLAAGLIMAVICGGIIVSGWFAGVMTDRYERFFWGGAITAGVAVFTLAVASMPFGSDDRAAIMRLRVLTTVGLSLFLVAAVLCIGAMVADFYG